MTHSSTHYAEALYEALHGKVGKARTAILDQFLTTLFKNHQLHQLHKILAHYEKVFLKKNSLRKVDVESASPLSAAVRKEIQRSIGGEILLTETVNPGLIAGMTILVDDSTYIDASARTHINNLLR